ncbi:MAG: SIS domain-containing protein, partial [Paludibacteraceae bacterium]|nr:SIS domain-containing protein [Paludibacteraceae bacterium]
MDFVARSKEVFQVEINEIQRVANRIGDEINQVVELIYAHTGKVVITGIGKTGIIGKKIAASLASTGTQAIFINAAEALHGDLGIVSRGDVVIAISNSGESEEILNVVQTVKKMDCPLVAITGDPNSTLAKQADY